MKLNLVYTAVVSPNAPYNFKYSTQNPSHYPTPTSMGSDNTLYFTLHWNKEPVGVRLVNKGSTTKPLVEITLYSKGEIDTNLIMQELSYRFEWYEDYSEFYDLTKKDHKLAPLLSKFKGMRMFCTENLYDYLMIAILLQNTNVKRTAQMTKVMLEQYGGLLEFDDKKLYCFWTPEQLLKISEEELRSLKVGYRAKSFLRASQDYLKLHELEMRNLNDIDLRKALLSIYGVGPASLDYLMRDVFHRRDSLNIIPLWEARIYSKIFGINTLDSVKILTFIKKRYGAWRAVAIHYLFMDLNWKHKAKPIEWFGKLMPY